MRKKSFKKLLSYILSFTMIITFSVNGFAMETFGAEAVIFENDVIAEGEDFVEEFDDTVNPVLPYDLVHPEVIEEGTVEYSENKLLVKFESNFDGSVHEDLKKAGVADLSLMFESEDGVWYVAYLYKDVDINETLSTVRECNGVVIAEYDYICEVEDSDYDEIISKNPEEKNQDSYDQCKIKESWEWMNQRGIAGGSEDIIVAVLDSGVDYTHEDLDNNIWTNENEIKDDGLDNDKNGYIDDYYGPNVYHKLNIKECSYCSSEDVNKYETEHDITPMDNQGHGTHVAGIIAAENNDIGTVGIAYNVKIMPVKILVTNEEGENEGNSHGTAMGIYYAVENGADVINMSIGSSGYSLCQRDALKFAYEKGCILVASAGNDGLPNESADQYEGVINYPATDRYVIGVMNIDSNGCETSTSNWDVSLYDESWDYNVYAPGEEIISTFPENKYAKMSGTSMSVPIVSAQAALLRSYYNDIDKYPIEFIYGQIVGTADGKVTCYNETKHKINGETHDIPGAVNFEKSIREYIAPEVCLVDYDFIDLANFSEDTVGLTTGSEMLNNANGSIDAGEIIALGIALKNHGGASKNTIVRIEAIDENGEADPYITMLNNDISYGDIGTYLDSEIIYNTDGEFLGYETPFYIKVSEECPADHKISLTVEIMYESWPEFGNTTTLKSYTMTLSVVPKPAKCENETVTFDCVWYGNYYQSDEQNKEVVKWRVLSVENNKALLISDKNLDFQVFRTKAIGTSWANSDLKVWLNNTFKNNAFSDEEQRALIEHSSTTDRVFVLSNSELKSFNFNLDVWLGNDTKYVKKIYDEDTSSLKGEGWWLRSIGVGSTSAYLLEEMFDKGNLGTMGAQYKSKVRPCVYLDLSKTESWAYAGTVTSDGGVNEVHKHIWNTGEITKAPTCTMTGVKTFTCTVCDETKSESVPVDKTLHPMESIKVLPAKAATCKDIGLTAGKKCIACDVVIVPQTEEPKLSTHSYNSGVVTKQPTCNEEGVKNFTCTVCNEMKIESTGKSGHSWKSATCTKAMTCKVCRITSGAKLNHNYSSSYTTDIKATTSSDGIKSKHCTRDGCTAKTSVTTIPKVSTVKLSKSTYTYNGKVKTPSIIVKDKNGNKLKKDVDYKVTIPSGRKNAGTYTYKVTFKGNYSGTKNLKLTIKPKKIDKLTLSTSSYVYNGKAKKPKVTVKAGTLKPASKVSKSNRNVTITYAKGRKNVGSYKVTVKGKGNYTGSLTKTFKIKPKGTSISTIKKGKKSFSVKWKKQSAKMSKSRITGYQIRYSTSSTFKNAKTTTVKGYKKTTKKITALKSKKTYYVKVRTYKTVKGVKYYSKWSKVKTVKTK